MEEDRCDSIDVIFRSFLYFYCAIVAFSLLYGLK